MKALKCSTPGCAGHPLMPGVATLRDGSPYLVGGLVAHWPLKVHCWTCKQKTTLTQIDFNRLPQLKPEDIAHIPAEREDPKDHADFGVMTAALRRMKRA